MSLRNLVTLLAVFGTVLLGLWTATLNTDQVTFRVPGFPPDEVQTSLWVVTFLAILLGVLGTLLYTVVLSSKAAFMRWRRKRVDLKTAEDTELIQLGLAAAVRGDHQTALQHFEIVLQKDPERLNAWIYGGNAARALGNMEKAIEMHMRARGVAPNGSDVHDELARDFAVLGKYARAVGHLEQRLSVNPKGDLELFARMRDLLAAQCLWDDACDAQGKHIKLLHDASERRDAEALARGLRLEKGRALMEQSTMEARQEALSIFASLLKADPQFVPAYLLQGRARFDDGDVDGAVNAWTKGIAATRSLELLNELVTHYFEAGDPEQAIRAFHQSMELITGEDGRAARLGLALLYSRLEMIEEAKAELEHLESEVEFSPTVTYHLAKLSERQGENETAAKRFRQIIQAANLLEPIYCCEHCNANHPCYVMHCEECGRWGTVVLDTSEELQEVEAQAVRAPRI
ncbi:MAG: tetratricopeptide repeat protein [Acidobacteriota bacterium]|nr:tetratricopeptide repeat protein [Acidobacteriota bacterium]